MSVGGTVGLGDWLIDTFIYTSLLIGLVLLLRSWVARHFGAQIAYALWALPMLRLILPPLVLPAWMAPAEPVAETAAAAGEPLMVIISDTPAAASDVPPPPEVGLTAMELLLPLWIGGALVFLGWRIVGYVRMRRELLADIRPVGESGKVRLVETPAVSAPVAFGIRDKVVALPVDFMALLDVRARDMAIAHELEHHRGHDLLANIAAQLLLALHWFNPLAWWGWRAMRRDQEAACDARVVAGRARSERAVYAEVIAGFAAGEHLALAAPMACPVLGEKSIIHRLRSLTMDDISTRRRRIGITAITTTALALPLTASISYAAPEPVAEADAQAIQTVDPDVEPNVWVAADPDVVVDNERHVVVRVVEDEDGERRVIRRVIRHGDGADTHMSEAELEAMRAEIERELEGLDAEVEAHVEMAMAHSMRAAEMGQALVVIEEGEEGSHKYNIRCNGEDPVVQRDLGNGRRAMMICHTAIRAHAANGIEGAMSAIRANPNLSEEMRQEIVEDLEEALEDLRETRTSALDLRGKSERTAERRAEERARVAQMPSIQTIRMVSPITGVPMAPAAKEPCPDTPQPPSPPAAPRAPTRLSA